MALELAAARLRVLSATELTARLDDVVSTLDSGVSTVDEGVATRHSTLHAAVKQLGIDWADFEKA